MLCIIIIVSLFTVISQGRISSKIIVFIINTAYFSLMKKHNRLLVLIFTAPLWHHIAAAAASSLYLKIRP